MAVFISLFPVLGLSLAIGALANRTSSCGVVAVKHWRDHGQLDSIFGLVLAAGGAAIAILVLGGLAPSPPASEGGTPLLMIILGAMLIGVGAVMNDACLLGSLSRLGDGEVRFFLVFPGLALGFWAADFLKPSAEIGLEVSQSLAVLPMPSMANLALAAFAAGFVWLFWPWSHEGANGAWPVRWSMPIFGAIGGALFCLYPSWSYSDAIHKAVESATRMMGPKVSALGLACILALSLGARLAGMRNTTHAWTSIDAKSGLRSLGGAICMGFGGALAGGGNDRLLFWSLPHLGLAALLTYGILTATIAILIWRSPSVPKDLIP